ncbi:MAG: tRNA lysidine(34) synthetase TilS [Alphaproteobacteria bacterium]|nr:tRNA lysidine(34) synthetase TilS [Alphaproteobacteria bacterium]
MPVIDASWLAQRIAALSLKPDERVAVAVSGGADSVCLALLMKKARLNIVAVTIDHGLRPESAAEAAAVHAQMRRLKIPHETLAWTGAKPKTRIEETARAKRYELLTRFCRDNGIQFLFLAHHQNDQAETFWARLARGSGLDGLAAMDTQTGRGGITLVRPLLDQPKQAILDTLKKHRQTWAEDAMNADAAFERVRWRRHQKTLSDIGLTPEKVGKSAGRLARAKQALDFYARQAFRRCVRVYPQGYALIRRDADNPPEIQIRLIQLLLDIIGQSDRPASLDFLENYIAERPKTATIGDCCLTRHKNGLYVAKEYARQEKPKHLPAGVLDTWDRFLVYATADVVLSNRPVRRDDRLPHLVRQSLVQAAAGGKPVAVRYIRTDKELAKIIGKPYKKGERKSVYCLLTRSRDV